MLMRIESWKAAPPARKGGALAMSLAVIALISALGVGLVQLQAALDRRQVGAADRRRALYVAEAGLSEATLAISQGRSGAVASDLVPALIGDGIYWVESEDLAGGRILLTSHAAVGTARFSVQALVMPNVSPVGSYGFFGDELVWIGWGALLDGYDSNEGSYASQLDPSLPVRSTGEGVEIYSNGDILFEDSPAITAPAPAVALGADTVPGASSYPAWDAFGGSFGSPARVTAIGSQSDSDFGAQYWATVDGVRQNISTERYDYLAQHFAGGLSIESIESMYASAAPGQPAVELASATPVTPLALGGSNQTYVFGEAVPGPDSYVQTSGAAHLSDSAAPSKEPLSMPAVVVPRNARVGDAARVVGAGETYVVTAEDLRHEALTVLAGGTLVVRGPATLVASTLDVASEGALILDDSQGPVRVYAADRLDLSPGSLLTSPVAHEDAFGTFVFVGGGNSAPGSRVTFAASGEFHGVLYAPQDDVLLPDSLRFFGAAAGKRLLLQAGAFASYDRAFATDGLGVPSLPKILSWQIVPIEEGEIRSLRFDPVATLRMQGIEPIASSVAALEQGFEIQFLDAAGALRTWAGDSTQFNWAQVARVTSLRWVSPATGEPLRWTVPTGSDPDGLVANYRAELRESVYGTVAPAPKSSASPTPALTPATALQETGTAGLSADLATGFQTIQVAQAAPAPQARMAARPPAAAATESAVDPTRTIESETAASLDTKPAETVFVVEVVDGKPAISDVGQASAAAAPRLPAEQTSLTAALDPNSAPAATTGTESTGLLGALSSFTNTVTGLELSGAGNGKDNGNNSGKDKGNNDNPNSTASGNKVK